MRSGDDCGDQERLGVNVEELIDEARLTSCWPAIQARALADQLARALAAEHQVDLGASALTSAGAALWQQLGLETDDELTAWLDDRGLDVEGARQLAISHAAQTWARRVLDDGEALQAQLYLSAEFPVLRQRAEAKRNALSRHQLDGLPHPPSMRGMHDLLAWWRTQDHPAQSTLDIEQWFDGWGEFQRLATREYLYRSTGADATRSQQLSDADLVTESLCDAREWDYWRMLGPADEFGATLWGRHPRHVPAGTTDHPALALSLEAIDHLVCDDRTRLRILRNRVFERDTQPAGSSEPQSNDPALVAADLRGGAMVVVRNTERQHPTIGAWAAELSQVLDAEVDAMLFVAVPRAVTRWHTDPSDNFVVQLSGHKRWVIAASTEGADDIEFETGPGDVLYVPRHRPHRVTCGERPAIHLTFCCRTPTASERLAEELTAGLGHQTVIDPPTPPPHLGPLSAQRFRADRAAAGDALRSALSTLAEREPRRNQPPARRVRHDTLRRALAALEVGPRTGVTVCDGYAPVVTVDERGAAIAFGDRAVRGPRRLGDALRRVAERAEGFASTDLGIGDDGLVLVRRLVSEGLLRPRPGEAG